MRVVPVRRTWFALLAFWMFISCVAAPVLARSPLEVRDAAEGDPGDGVLRPRLVDGKIEDDPLKSDVTATVTVATPLSGRPAFAVWRSPVLVHLPVTGWYALTPRWLFLEGRWTYAP